MRFTTTTFQHAKVTAEEYSEKSFVVRGEDTKKLKAYIKEFGKWNTRLRGGPGWIIAKKKKKDFEARINFATKPKLVGKTRNLDHWRLNRYERDTDTGKYKCRGHDTVWDDIGIDEKMCDALTDNPCGVCDKHHCCNNKDHKKHKGECIHRTGVWYIYKKGSEKIETCFPI